MINGLRWNNKKSVYISRGKKLSWNTDGLNLSTNIWATLETCSLYIKIPRLAADVLAYLYERRSEVRFFRPDVLAYESDPLESDLIVSGPIIATFSSQLPHRCRLIVKVIDVFPDDEKNPDPNPNSIELGGYQRLIRFEMMRGKFRNSCEKPEPFTPGQVTEVKINLNDIDHKFLKGIK